MATIQRRNTRQRQLVLDAVQARKDHPTADDIYLAVRSRDMRVSRATIYRNLHLLAAEGKIHSVPTPSGEHFDLRCDDHAHVVCSVCGAVLDAPLPYQRELDSTTARDTGWQITGHETLFNGVCPACQANEMLN